MSTRPATEQWARLWDAAIARPRLVLLPRVFYAVLAIDCWRLVMARGASHGSGGFNVAHLSWLDGLGLPTPGLRYGALFVAGFVSACMALGGPTRVGGAGVMLAYSYAWAMSRLDSFQHHYFLSLGLVCLALAPPAPEPSRAEAPAWSVKLLAATAIVMYLFAIIAKIEPRWLSGATVEHILAHAPRVPHMGRLGGQLFAIGTILVEGVVVAGYAAFLFRPDMKRIQLAGWVAALALHLGIEWIGLNIGMFSSYVLALATVLLGPERVLARVATALDGLAERIPSVIDRGPFAAVSLLLVVMALVVTGKLIELDIPGAASSAAVSAAVILASAGSLVIGPNEAEPGVPRLRHALAGTCLALGSWWLCIAVGAVEINPVNLAGWVGL
jgi:HTTM domain